jgi:hypothetical protein
MSTIEWLCNISSSTLGQIHFEDLTGQGAATVPPSIDAEHAHAKREAQLCAMDVCEMRRISMELRHNRALYLVLARVPSYGDSFMKTYIALITVALVSTAAFAQQEPQSPAATTNAATSPPPASASPGLSEIFDKLDTNHDGKLSQDEAQAAPTVATNFAASDRDHDGAVSRDEFLAAFKAGPQ